MMANRARTVPKQALVKISPLMASVANKLAWLLIAEQFLEGTPVTTHSSEQNVWQSQNL
jgi:hypothetical protein